MIIVYMQDTLKLLKEFPKPTRVGQTERGAYVVYELLEDKVGEWFARNADMTIEIPKKK